MDTLIKCLWVGSAGFLGAIARYFVASVCARLTSGFPVGTMLINLSGSLALGWFASYAGKAMVSEEMRLAVAVGFLGAYTTFSTFMLESDILLRGGFVPRALLNLIGSLVLGLICVRAGWLLGAR